MTLPDEQRGGVSVFRAELLRHLVEFIATRIERLPLDGTVCAGP